MNIESLHFIGKIDGKFILFPIDKPEMLSSALKLLQTDGPFGVKLPEELDLQVADINQLLSEMIHDKI